MKRKSAFQFNLSTLLMMQVVLGVLMYLDFSESQFICLIGTSRDKTTGDWQFTPFKASCAGWPLRAYFAKDPLPILLSETEAENVWRAAMLRVGNDDYSVPKHSRYIAWHWYQDHYGIEHAPRSIVLGINLTVALFLAGLFGVLFQHWLNR